MISPQKAILIFGLFAVLVGRVAGATWIETRAAIEELAGAGEYAAAIQLEETLSGLVIEEFGELSPELAESQMFMASIHADNGDYLAAEERILSALELYESSQGHLSIQLIEPYMALGDSYHSAGAFDLALGAYNEAKTLGRRTFGLLNSEQLFILDKMSQSALALGQFDEADILQREVLTLINRIHGEDSVEYLEANYQYGAWLSGQYRYVAADNQFFGMYKLISDEFDDDPLLEIALLRVDADNFRRARGRGIEQYRRTNPNELRNAIKLLDALETPEPVLRAGVLIDLGDWNVVFDRGRDVEEAYEEAWEVLSSFENGEELRNLTFSDLAIVYSAPMNSRVITQEEGAPRGYLKASFTINLDGRADDIVILEADPPGVLDDAAIRQIRDSRYRPRMANGVLIESTSVVAWDYQYRDW